GAGGMPRPERRPGRGVLTWADRVFTMPGGRERAVATMWDAPPRWLAAAVGLTRLLGTPPFTALFELTRADGYQTLETDCGAAMAVDGDSRLRPDSAAAA